MCVAKVDDNVETTPEHKRSSSEKVLPEENSLGNGKIFFIIITYEYTMYMYHVYHNHVK